MNADMKLFLGHLNAYFHVVHHTDNQRMLDRIFRKGLDDNGWNQHFQQFLRALDVIGEIVRIANLLQLEIIFHMLQLCLHGHQRFTDVRDIAEIT